MRTVRTALIIIVRIIIRIMIIIGIVTESFDDGFGLRLSRRRMPRCGAVCHRYLAPWPSAECLESLVLAV